MPLAGREKPGDSFPALNKALLIFDPCPSQAVLALFPPPFFLVGLSLYSPSVPAFSSMPLPRPAVSPSSWPSPICPCCLQVLLPVHLPSLTPTTLTRRSTGLLRREGGHHPQTQNQRLTWTSLSCPGPGGPAG